MATETKQAHTPGPWKYRMMGSEGARIFPDTGNMREDMKFIAMVNGRDFHADEANARLIVNAVNGYKELLEALTLVVSRFDYNPGHSDLDNEQPIHLPITLGDYRRIRSLIHRAEGK